MIYQEEVEWIVALWVVAQGVWEWWVQCCCKQIWVLTACFVADERGLHGCVRELDEFWESTWVTNPSAAFKWTSAEKPSNARAFRVAKCN